MKAAGAPLTVNVPVCVGSPVVESIEKIYIALCDEMYPGIKRKFPVYSICGGVVGKNPRYCSSGVTTQFGAVPLLGEMPQVTINESWPATT
jgi:hypothetical protein